MPKKITTYLVLCFFLFNPILAFSSVDSKLEGEFRWLEEELEGLQVITASKMTQEIDEAPGTIIVITQRQIRERGYVNLVDLLEDLPSVDVFNKSVEEFYNIITFRGNANQSKFIIMRDSQRVSSPTGESIPIADNFPLFNAKQVEILYGPVSALYGADAFTGIINIITEDAEKLDGVVISSSVASFGHYSGHLRYGKKITENIALTFGGHYQSADNADLSKYYSEFDPVDLTLSGSTYLSAANRESYVVPTDSYSSFVKLDLFNDFTLGFSQSYLNHPSGSGQARTHVVMGKDQKWETLIRNYYGEYSFEEGENFSAKSTLSYSTYEVLPNSKFRNTFTSFEDGYKYARSNKFMIEQQVNYQFRDDHLLTGGISWENFYSQPKNADLSKPFDPSLPADSQDLFYGGTDNTLPMKIFQLYYNNIGAYFQAQSEWTDKISSNVGVRFDHSSRYGDTFNPRGGIIYNPTEKTSLEFFYGEAFLAPSPYDAYAHYGAFSGTKNSDGEYISTFMNLPNPDLKPQKVKSPEINLTHKFTPDLKVVLTGYYSWVDNVIATKGYSTTSKFISGGVITFWQRNENLGTAEIYGGDLRLDYQKKAGAFDYKFWGNYSYTDGWVDTGSGVKVELFQITNHKVKTGLTATYDNKYYITPTIRWNGISNHGSVDSNDNTKRVKIPSYTLVNLHAGINNLYKGLSASITVRNLLDNRYYNVGPSRLSSSPQDPREIMGTLEYKF